MPTEYLKTTVCIVGAGPSGTATSLTLAKMGIPHVIVDAADFPRDKICGDGIDLKVIRVLNHIDPSIVQNELPVSPFFSASMGMRFILPNGKQVEVMADKNGSSVYQHPVFYVSKRKEFDQFLFGKINRQLADVHTGTRIEKMERTGDTWLLHGKKGMADITIETKLVVGADGDHSVVLKHVGERKVQREHYAAAVRQYWKDIDGMHDQKLIEIYFPASLPFSYFWIFPLNNKEANVGYGMASNHVAKKNVNVRQAFEELIRTDPYMAQRFKRAQPLETTKGWGVPMATLNRQAHGDGWLLVGDAASLVCPTSGEGIGTGMLSGYIASLYIQRAVQQQNYSAAMFSTYDRELHKRLKQEEKLYRMINRMPDVIFTTGLNFFLSSPLFKKWYTRKEMPRWLDTAFDRPINVNFS